MTDRRDPPDDDGPSGPAGTPFPAEHEWLDLPLPGDLDRFGFVERTMDALHAASLPARANEDDGGDVPLPREVLAAFRSPEPSPGFVARTMDALQQDQARHLHDVLARYAAPEPSPAFVARTLAALAVERDRTAAAAPRSSAGLRRAWPLLAVAAGAAVWLGLSLLRRDPDVPSLRNAPFEARLAHGGPRAFAHTYATTPLGAVLTTIAHRADPRALPDGDVDGAWLLLEGSR